MQGLTRLAAAAGALILATAVAGGANAATYLLQYSDAFGTGNFGKVVVTGNSTDLHFDVTLNSPYKIIDAGVAHRAFAMNLGGSNFALTGYTPSQFTLSTGSMGNSPFTGFDVALNCVACGPGGSAPWGSSLSFDITGTNLSVQKADDYNSHTIYFAADVIGAAGATGPVGGGSITAVPEPAAWALMIIGFGGIGASLRARRRLALAI